MQKSTPFLILLCIMMLTFWYIFFPEFFYKFVFNFIEVLLAFIYMMYFLM